MTTTSPFSHRSYVFFWFSRICTASAFQIVSVALGWQVYALTHDVFDLGLIGLIQFAPRVLFMLHSGIVADRYDRRRVIGCTQFTQAMVALLLTASGVLYHASENIIFILAFVLGIARTFEMPATQALLPLTVPETMLERAVAASAAAIQAATIVAPALGGFLYALGANLVYLLAGLFFALGCTLVSIMPTNQQMRTAEHSGSQKKTGNSLHNLLAGIRFIRARPDILGAISLDLFAVLLGGATALLPAFARDILMTGPWGLGLLRSAPAAGALITSLLMVRFPLRHSVGRIMFICVAIFGLATIVFGLSTSFWLSLFALFVLGAADMVSVVIRSSFVQMDTPNEMRGRVSAVNALFIGASNQLGEFESGLTAAWFGTVAAVVLGGAGTLLIAGLWVRLFPSLAKRQQLRTAA